MIQFITGDGILNKTAAGGTRIQTALGGLSARFFTHITQFSYTPGATDHTITLMRGASHSSAQVAIAAAGTVLVTNEALTDGDGNAAATGDCIAIQMDDGRWHPTLTTVSGNTFTLTSAIPTGRSVLAGAKVVCYGAAGDALHARHQIVTTSGQALVVGSGDTSLCKSMSQQEPIIIDSNNTINQGKIDFACAGYTEH